MERGGAMVVKAERLPEGSCGVVVRARKTPRLQALGLTPGATVYCKYKSRGIVVLEINDRLLALRRPLRKVWVDY